MNDNIHAEQDLQSIKNASSGQLLQSLLWNRHDLPSLEHGRLCRHHDGFTLTGTVVASLEGRTLHCSYEVETTSSWETRKVRITLSSGTEEQSLHLERDDDGRWWNGDTELTAFAGMTDIDLGITPSTNTLPIRRLQLEPGESAAMTAVWIQFPSLTVVPPQRYTRTGNSPTVMRATTERIKRIWRLTNMALSQRTQTYGVGLAKAQPIPGCECSPCRGSISRETVIASPDPCKGSARHTVIRHAKNPLPGLL